MVIEDFYKLRIGQEIYHKGKIKEILHLSISDGGHHEIGFGEKDPDDEECSIVLVFFEIMEDLSFGPPKEKKRYWQWKILNSVGVWYRADAYYDDDGYATNRCRAFSTWKNIEKIKIEDDFIDV